MNSSTPSMHHMQCLLALRTVQGCREEWGSTIIFLLHVVACFALQPLNCSKSRLPLLACRTPIPIPSRHLARSSAFCAPEGALRNSRVTVEATGPACVNTAACFECSAHWDLVTTYFTLVACVLCNKTPRTSQMPCAF